jgi:MFS family permease
VVGFVVGYGAGNGLLTLARATAVADLFGTERYGSVAGRLAAFATCGRAAGPLVAGWLYDVSGRYEPLLATMIVALGLIAPAAVLGAFRHPGKAARPPR